MIHFQQTDNKKITVLNNNEPIVTLEVHASTVTNKFYIITNFIENMSKHSKKFTKWFVDFLREYQNDSEKYPIIVKNIPIIKQFVDDYLKYRNIDYSQFVDESKAKKTSILFMPDEIERIIKLSSYLKIYAIISNTNLKLDQRLHKEIYNSFAEELNNSETMYKIFNVVKTKTFRYNMTDKYMWDYIKMVQCKSIDVHVMEIFNFIMNSIIILCEEDKNPITYFVGVIEESVKWFLRSVYKGSIIYDDSIQTEDIQSSNIDNVRTYAYNDTLERLKGIAYNQLYDMVEKPSILLFNNNENENEKDRAVQELQNRISHVEFISPLCEYLVYPILAKITGVPYSHFKTLSPENSIVLSVYTFNLLKRVFRNDYKNLFSLLLFYPGKIPSLITTYKCKNMELFVNCANAIKNFFGFNTKLLLGNMLSNFVGKISRSDFYNIIDGKKVSGVPLSKIESEMIQFYILLFSGNMDEELEKMKKFMYLDF